MKRLTAAIIAPLFLFAFAPTSSGQDAVDPYAAAIDGAETIGDGAFRAYRSGAKLLLELPEDILSRAVLWYAEAASLPPEAAADAIGFDGVLVRFERPDASRVIVRDLSGSITRRARGPEPYEPKPSTDDGGAADAAQPSPAPIAASVSATSIGPVMATLPVIGASADGRMLVDATAVFSTDVPRFTGRRLVAKSSLVAQAVDPAASFVSRVAAHERDIDIRVHITFLAVDPKEPAAGPRPISMEIGHSLVLLPETPMRPRLHDPRVGYFPTQYTAFETTGGGLVEKQELIERFRLEKKDPSAEVSDPVKPIVFWIGRGVPDRWRPWIKRGVEMWRPAFEAAGFSNAIEARNAPSAAEDPNWSAENASHSVIRWLAQPKANAMGPHIVDPRSGEVISAHILVWPQVIEYFERYYHALFSTLDQYATRLPMPEEQRGVLLQYAIAHEVGHTIGLRHNQLASTVYSVEHLRDPARANATGPNSSIMAYGRFNQAAQPGDGVTEFHPGIGPYDFFAIDWGYGVHGATPAEEAATLKVMVDRAMADRALIWGAAEAIEELEAFAFDPRVQTENVGADRLEATKLGVANLMRTLAQLDVATGGDRGEYRGALNVLFGAHQRFVMSVDAIVAGMNRGQYRGDETAATVLPAADQAAAVAYLLGEGAASFDAYLAPDVLSRGFPVGGAHLVASAQAKLVGDLLEAPIFVLLAQQKIADPENYGPLDLARDAEAAIFADLSAPAPWRRALQDAYLDHAASFLKAAEGGAAAEAKTAAALEAAGFSSPFSAVMSESGDDTIWPAFLRDSLPNLAMRLDAAAEAADDDETRLHFRALARKAKEVSK